MRQILNILCNFEGIVVFYRLESYFYFFWNLHLDNAHIFRWEYYMINFVRRKIALLYPSQLALLLWSSSNKATGFMTSF